MNDNVNLYIVINIAERQVNLHKMHSFHWKLVIVIAYLTYLYDGINIYHSYYIIVTCGLFLLIFSDLTKRNYMQLGRELHALESL